MISYQDKKCRQLRESKFAIVDLSLQMYLFYLGPELQKPRNGG